MIFVWSQTGSLGDYPYSPVKETLITFASNPLGAEAPCNKMAYGVAETIPFETKTES